MNVDQFLKASLRRISPTDFLKEHNTFLRSLHGALIPPSASAQQTDADKVSYRKVQEAINSILNRVEKRDLQPTPALNQIGQLLLTLPSPPKAKPGKPCDPNKKKKSKVYVDLDGNEIVEEVSSTSTGKRNPPRYTIILYVGTFDHSDPKQAPKVKEMLMVDEVWKERLYQDAEGKAHRLLYKREDSIEAHIVSMDDGVITRITRTDAVHALFKKKGPGPVCKPQIKSAKLNWGPRTHDYKQHFSKG